MVIITKIFAFIISLYLLAILLRFFMQWFRVSFYNPVSQAIVKITDPVLIPLRRVIPGYMGLDTSALVVAYVLCLLLLSVNNLIWIRTDISFFTQVLPGGLFQLFYSFLQLIWYLVIIRIIIGFIFMVVVPGTRSPFVDIIFELTQPILAPFQRLIPPLGMFDFSPIILFILIYFSQYFIVIITHHLFGLFIR